jgi:hypothetical protein
MRLLHTGASSRPGRSVITSNSAPPAEQVRRALERGVGDAGDDHVVGGRGGVEVLGGVVDHSLRAEAGHQLPIGGAADTGHLLAGPPAPRGQRRR